MDKEHVVYESYEDYVLRTNREKEQKRKFSMFMIWWFIKFIFEVIIISCLIAWTFKKYTFLEYVGVVFLIWFPIKLFFVANEERLKSRVIFMIEEILIFLIYLMLFFSSLVAIIGILVNKNIPFMETSDIYSFFIVFILLFIVSVCVLCKSITFKYLIRLVKKKGRKIKIHIHKKNKRTRKKKRG